MLFDQPKRRKSGSNLQNKQYHTVSVADGRECPPQLMRGDSVIKMDMTIALRRAESQDIDRIKIILFGALNEYSISLPDNYSVSDINSIKNDNQIEKVFVLERNRSVIGFIVLIPINKDCIELKRLYLASSERGKRLGNFLLKCTINFASRNDYKCIRLETTSKFKEAVSLYKKHGFIELKDLQKAPGHDLAFEKMIER